nr:hypothetical protein [Tanacetum cinerariifolium]
MDVKSAFLYGTIKEEVYVCQPLRFEEPGHPDKVYKVVKALYGLHQAPRDWYETLATYLLKNGFHIGQIDQTLFIKKQKGDILLMQIYVDNIIFGLQVNQKEDEIFINQDKYVAEILKKFGLTKGKSASTPINTEKPLLKDPNGEDVDVHIYRSMIGPLMYLTSSRPDIMFAVCTCARFQVTLKVSHLHAGFLNTLRASHTWANVTAIDDFIDQSIQSPTPLTPLPQQPQDIPSTSQVQSPPPQQQSPPPTPPQGAHFPMSLLQEALDACVALTRHVKHLEHDKRIESSDDTLMEDVSNQGREFNRAEDVVKETKEVREYTADTQVEGRQADIYHIDMDHAAKVLSMQEDELEVQEAVEVVTTAKLITKVVAAVSETVSVAAVIPSVVPETISAAVIPTVTTPSIKVAAPLKVTVPSTK